MGDFLRTPAMFGTQNHLHFIGSTNSSENIKFFLNSLCPRSHTRSHTNIHYNNLSLAFLFFLPLCNTKIHAVCFLAEGSETRWPTDVAVTAVWKD